MIAVVLFDRWGLFIYAYKEQIHDRQRWMLCVTKGDTFAKWLPLTPFTRRCPHCGSRNNSHAEGGNEHCFHCGDCGWVDCAGMQI